MIKIDTFVLGQLQTNCYLISNKSGCWLIDPADDCDFISNYICQHNLSLKSILLTHGHYDHCLAVFELQTIFKCPVYLSYKDLPLIKNLTKSVFYWQSNQNIKYIPPKITNNLDNIEKLSCLGQSCLVIPTPGHSPGSVSFYFPSQKLLFSGDTLFKGGIGRTDLSYSDPKKIKISLRTIANLPHQTAIMPGHGSMTSIKKEVKNLDNFL